jgi:O-antigen ligase
MIWNYTAETALNAPWIGIGANATYVLGPELEKSTPYQPNGSPFRDSLSIHAHNVYLQTWLELGVVGAMLLTLFGLSVLGVIGRLAPEVQPYGYATFSSIAAMASASYGMWQYWFVALFGLVTIAFAIGARLLLSRPIR